MSKSIKWVDEGKHLSLMKVKSLEEELNVTFPLYYKKIIQSHDGGSPKKDTFKYFDKCLEKEIYSGIGSFIPLFHNIYTSLKTLAFNPPEFFPKNIIAFAEPGNGDFICFDYRERKDHLDPSIVYWNHEADLGKDLSFIANNFEEFIDMLQESEEI